MHNSTHPYESGCDIIRVTAIIFVIAGHFLSLYTDFMRIPMSSFSHIFQGALLSILYLSVPLFVLLSGYLNSRKTYKSVTLRTFKGISKVTVSYLIFALISILFRHYWIKQDLSIIDYIKLTLNFSISPYAWYIEMYLGLFLFMPFLNILMKKLDEIDSQKYFLGVLILCGLLPAMVNRGGFEIFPNLLYYTSSVFAYYCIGFYIGQHQPKINKLVLISIILTVAIIDSVTNFIFNRPYSFIGGDVWSLYYAIPAVALFLLLYDINVRSVLLRKLSYYTLDIYLCCWMCDAIYYPFFKSHFYESNTQFFKYILIIAPLVYFSSLVIAIIKDKTQKLIISRL